MRAPRRQPVLSSRGLHLKDGPSQYQHRLTGLVTTLLNKQPQPLEPLPPVPPSVPLSRPAALLRPSVLQTQVVPGPDRSS